MKNCRYYIVCLACTLLSTQFAFGQGSAEPSVTNDFADTPLEQFLNALERQTHYRFFYDNAEFDSTKISLSVKQQPLSRVLKLAFDSTSFKFSIDNKNRVFVSKGHL